MLVNLDKRGTVILSNYRSGGTLLKNVIINYLGFNSKPCVDLGEINIQLSERICNETISRAVNSLYCEEEYSVCLLNNPTTISIFVKSGYIKNIIADFNVIYLERKDKEKGVLSLPLWEEFIDTGLYYERDNWTKEAMQSFHKKLLEEPIPYWKIGLGQPYEFASGKAEQFLNATLITYYNSLFVCRTLSKDYNLHSIFYESYEKDAGILKDLYFKNEPSELREIFLDLQKDKIPYVSSNYLDYYDETTKRVFKDWNLNSI